MFQNPFSKKIHVQPNTVFERKNVLVTGGAGFIGSHLCESLVKEANVICVDNFSSGNETNIDHLLSDTHFRFIRHDINIPLKLNDLKELEVFKMRFQGIQEIYHLACPHAPTDFEDLEESTLLVNTLGVKNIFDLAKEYGSRVVHFSSAVVYGGQTADKHLFREDEIGHVDQLSGRASYDEGKRIAETFASYYARRYKVPVSILRVFRTYGPRMPIDKGHMIPDFILAALDYKNVVIFGDKNFTTSLCYVSDVIAAAKKAMKLKDNLSVINIGSSEPVLLRDVAKQIIDFIESSSEITYDDPLLMMTPQGIPNVERAQKILGWVPLVSLENGLKKTMEYVKAEKSLLHL